MAGLTRRDLEACLPDVSSAFSLRGLGASATIFRDGWGIPYVRACSERDAFFAQGFATAQDRLWHMEYDLRRALGRWSEWAGLRGLEHDSLWRRLDIERAARADLEAANSSAREMLEGYCGGVNAFIETTRSLPVEYGLLGADPVAWEAWHCLAVYKVRNLPMGVWEMKVWRSRLARSLGAEAAARLFRGYQPGGLLTAPPGGCSRGRSWMVWMSWLRQRR